MSDEKDDGDAPKPQKPPQPLFGLVGDIDALLDEIKPRLSKPGKFQALVGPWKDPGLILDLQAGKTPLRNLIVVASPRCVFSNRSAARSELLEELLDLLRRLDGAASRPEDLDTAAKRAVKTVLNAVPGDEDETDALHRLLPENVDGFVKLLADHLRYVEPGEGEDRRPVVRLSLTGKPEGSKYRVSVNGESFLLSKGHFDALKVVYFEQQRGTDEKRPLAPTEKAVHGIQTRLAEIRRLDMPKDARRVLGALPEPLLDPHAPRFNEKLNVIVNYEKA